MVEVSLAGVTKRFGSTTALENVEFTVRDGEFFTLVGPSGCGKTTTLRTIAGFESPGEGRVRFGGELVAGGDVSVPPEERDVGVVFQNYALFPHMDVAENVAYGLKFRDPPEGVSTDRRVRELLELVDLEGMGDRAPDQLSGGQRQRVALARALAPGPQLLLLDEPMSALDARLRESLRRQVRSIQSELSTTTVYVTHDQQEALAISDRVAVMHEGRIEQVGRPREVYRTPETRFVAEFVGENNLFEGRVERDDDRTWVAVGDRRFEVAADAADGEDVLLCVRSGALSTGADANDFEVAVEDWEFLGESVRVRGEWAGHQVVFRAPEPPDGEVASVGFDPEDAHLLSI